MEQKVTDELAIDEGLVDQVLSFFNSVVAAQEIVDKIKDDQEFRGGGTGIGLTVAERIISHRNSFPDKKFDSIEQIRDVKGIGMDKMVDILDTFGYKLRGHIVFKVLHTFNNFTSRHQIIERIMDDPNFKNPHGYGIPEWTGLATRILNVRSNLPGGRFDTIHQIEEIQGVGRDVMHDIIYTLGYDGQPPIPEIGRAWGSKNRQFHFPFDVDIDGSGNVYVVDSNNHRLQRITPDGSFLLKLGEQGTGIAQFNYPRAIAIDAVGNIFVADTSGNHRIQKFDSAGSFLLQWGEKGDEDGQFNIPEGIAVEIKKSPPKPGNVYVADSCNHCIQKFDPDGNFLAKWGAEGIGEGQFLYPAAVAVDDDGNVYVADTYNSRIQKFDSNGNFLVMWGNMGIDDGQFHRPRGIAVDGAGDVYVADTTINHRIQKFDSNGAFILKWGSKGIGEGEFDAPEGIAVDDSGNVYVADTQNHRIQKFDSNGQFISAWESII